MIDTYNLLFLIFLNFIIITILHCPDYFSEVFCPVDDNGVATNCCNKKSKLPFCNSKLGMQSLLYVGFSTCNKLPNNLNPIQDGLRISVFPL